MTRTSEARSAEPSSQAGASMNQPAASVRHGADQYGLRPEASEFPMMLVLSFVYPCNAAVSALPLHEFKHSQGIPRRPLHARGDVQKDRRRIRSLWRLLAHLRGRRADAASAGDGAACLRQARRLQDRPDYQRLVVRRGELPCAAGCRRRHDRVFGRCLRPADLRRCAQGARMGRPGRERASHVVDAQRATKQLQDRCFRRRANRASISMPSRSTGSTRSAWTT